MSPVEAQFIEDAFLAVSCVIIVLGFCSWVCDLPGSVDNNDEYKKQSNRGNEYRNMNRTNRR